MDNMRLFRHKVTGKVDYFPDHFEEFPYMELAEPDEVTCEDCVVDLPDPEPEGDYEDNYEIEDVEDGE